MAEEPVLRKQAVQDSIDAYEAAKTDLINALNNLQTSDQQVQDAIGEALSHSDVDPNFISYTIGQLPPDASTDATIGAYFKNLGVLQKIKWDNSNTQWDEIGKPIITANSKMNTHRVISSTATRGGGGVVVCYDDGNESDYEKALPLHQYLQIPAVSNIATHLVGNSNFLTWSQINEMYDSGLFDIGNHTSTTSLLTSLSISDARTKIEEGFKAIVDNIGIMPNWFVAPGVDLNEDIQSLVYRLHRKQRRNSSFASTVNDSGLNLLTNIYSIDANNFQTQSELDNILDSIQSDVLEGKIIPIVFHNILASHPSSGTGISESYHKQVLQWLVEESIPVFHPRPLAERKDHNMIYNPSFSHNAKGWSLKDNSGTETAANIDSSDTKIGAHSVRLESKGGGSNGSMPYARQRINFPIQKGLTSFNLSFWAKANAVDNHKIRFRMIPFLENGSQETESFIYNAAIDSTSWKLFSGSYSVPTGVRHVLLEIHLYLVPANYDSTGLSPDPLKVWLDSISIIPSHFYDYNARNV